MAGEDRDLCGLRDEVVFAHTFTGCATRIKIPILLRFQAGSFVISASAARVLVLTVSARLSVQPFASG